MLGHVLNSKLGNFNIKALCVILDSPLLTSIPPLLYGMITSLVTVMGLNFIFFLSFSTQLIKQIYCCSLSSNSLLETGLLHFLWLFLSYSLHWYSHAVQTLIHFSAQCSCDMKRWHFPVLGNES